MEEQELLAQAGGDAKEEEGPRAEPQGAAEEGEESGGRRKIVLTPLEKLKLSTLNLTSEAEPEPPPKPARLRLQAAPEALPALWQGQGTWEKEEEMAVEEGRWLQAGVSGQAGLWVPPVPCCAPHLAHEAPAQNGSFLGAALEESDSEEEEEEKEEEESTDLGIMADLVSAFPERRWLGLLPVLPLTEALGPALPWLPGQEVPGAGTDTPPPPRPACATIPSQYLDLGEEEKYPTWKRTLTRRAREAQMKRFCKAQVAPQGESRVPSPAPSPIPSIPLLVAACREVPAHGRALPFPRRPSRGGWRRSR